MNVTPTQSKKLIEELENAIEQEIMLLQCLDVIYTKAMDLLEKQEYELFLEKIEDQQIIADSIDKIEADLKELSSSCSDSEIVSIINGSLKECDCSPEYRKLAGKVETSNKILSGCIALNEKLTYRANEVKENILANMTTAKNRRLIKLNYKNNSPSKVNVNFSLDC